MKLIWHLINLFNSIRKCKESTYPKLFAYILNYKNIYWWLFKYLLHISNLKIVKFVKWKGTKVIHLWHICSPLCRSRRGRSPSYFSECEETTKGCRDCHDIRGTYVKTLFAASKITGKTGTGMGKTGLVCIGVILWYPQELNFEKEGHPIGNLRVIGDPETHVT